MRDFLKFLSLFLAVIFFVAIALYAFLVTVIPLPPEKTIPYELSRVLEAQLIYLGRMSSLDWKDALRIFTRNTVAILGAFLAFLFLKRQVRTARATTTSEVSISSETRRVLLFLSFVSPVVLGGMFALATYRLHRIDGGSEFRILALSLLISAWHAPFELAAIALTIYRLFYRSLVEFTISSRTSIETLLDTSFTSAIRALPIVLILLAFAACIEAQSGCGALIALNRASVAYFTSEFPPL